MKSILDLKRILPQIGRIKWMGIRPEKKTDVRDVKTMILSEHSAIEGDHYSIEGGNRMVTLIQAEHIAVVESVLKKEINPELLRRNIVISGINLLSLTDTQFKIGEEVILEGTGLCQPCSRMEENLGLGGYNAMRGHGGITARVIRGGKVNLEDEVRLL